jgi:transcriptional regulator with XRE-family HTH domain
MAYSIELRRKAMDLRRKGYSLKEISERFDISKSTASLWLSDVALDQEAVKRLLTVIKRGQFVSARNKKNKIKKLEQSYLEDAYQELNTQPNYGKIICAMVYWCEGAKSSKKGICFTNSDPNLVKTFLKLLRENFILDEKKFHPCIHIHSYHSPKRQLDFWSKITDIDKQQFIKPYRKANTGKRIRENYQGCVSVRYGSSDLARRLMAIAKAYLFSKGA